ncbi:DUF3023 domain-containing protein [Ehrlichia ruminantium]|nr:DUF3023 domain-containing protein [Ehrlichia ruminantium]QLK55115.1 DUF3023 domain-containing protein [Ehrlichia ruminantium]QLK56032.1 DUF3023 domain-containing protein [Ehrlichia ruminantium]UOE00133.1 DUF3023 domain-containing protein [Ehrlichia ruminantium]CAH58166.1 hypothetical protein Erum4400 [Ehrlichia ruminantium str. Welgevonden]
MPLTFDLYAHEKRLNLLLCNAINSAANLVNEIDISCVGYTDETGKLVAFIDPNIPLNLFPIPQNLSLFRISGTIPITIITNSNSQELSKEFVFTEGEINSGLVKCEMYCLVGNENLDDFTEICSNPKIGYENLIKISNNIYTQLFTEDILKFPINIEHALSNIANLNAEYIYASDLVRKEKLKQLKERNDDLCNAICHACNEENVTSVKCIGHTPDSNQLTVHIKCPESLLPIPQSNSLFLVEMSILPNVIGGNQILSSTFELTESECKKGALNCTMYCLVSKEKLKNFTDECNNAKNNKPKLKDIIQHCSVRCIKLNTEGILSLQISEEQLINNVGICDATFRYFSDLRQEKLQKIQQINNELCSAICSLPEANKIIDVKCVGHTTTKNKLVVHTECPLALLPTPQGDSLFSILMAIPHTIIANNAILSSTFKVVKNDLGIDSDYILCTAYCLVTKHNLQDFTNEVSSDDVIDDTTQQKRQKFKNIIKLCSVKCVTLHTQEMLSLNISEEELINDIGLCNATFKYLSNLHQEKIDILRQANNKLCREICLKLNKHQTNYIRCIGNTVDNQLIVTTQCPRDLLPFPKNQSLFIIRINIPPNIILHSKILNNTFKLTKSEKEDYYIKCDMYCLVYEEDIKSFIDVCDDLDKPYIEELIQHCSVKCIKLYTQEMLSLNISEEELINDIGLCNAEFKYVESRQIIESVLDTFEYIEIQANKLLCRILPTLCALYKKDFLIKKIRCIGNTIDPEQGLTIYPPSIFSKEHLPTAKGTSLFLIRSRMLTEVILSTPELVNVHNLSDEEMSSKYLLCDIYCLVDNQNINLFKNLCTKTRQFSDVVITCDVRYIRIYTKDARKFPFNEASVLKQLGNIKGKYLNEQDFKALVSSGLYTKSASESSSAVSTEEESIIQQELHVKQSLKSRLSQIRKQLTPDSSSSNTVSSEDDIDTPAEIKRKREARRLKLAKLQQEESQTTGIGMLSDQEVSHHKSQSKDLD